MVPSFSGKIIICFFPIFIHIYSLLGFSRAEEGPEKHVLTLHLFFRLLGNEPTETTIFSLNGQLWNHRLVQAQLSYLRKPTIK